MKETYTRKEASEVLGCSLRTIDRWFPRGSPGRTERTPTPDKPDGVIIDGVRVRARLPLPVGDDDDA